MVSHPASVTFNNLSGNQAIGLSKPPRAHLSLALPAMMFPRPPEESRLQLTEQVTLHEAAEVVYSATDGSAEQRSDVIPVIGRLTFQPGEESKTFFVFVTDDSYVEGDEGLMLKLSDPVGADLGNSTAPLNDYG